MRWRLTSPSTLSSAEHMKSLVLRVVLVVAGSAFGLHAAHAGTLSVDCTAEYGAKIEKLRIPPTTDVFAAQSVTIGDRFRFQAQYLIDRSKFKTFVYELRDHSPTLIHASEHKLSSQNCAHQSTGFGLNKVYSSDLEREMFFQCFAVCE